MSRPVRHVERQISDKVTVCAECGARWPCRTARERLRQRRARRTQRHVCAICGPAPAAFARLQHCGLCGLDTGEVAYRELILRLGGDEVYRREWRAAQGLAATEGAA